MQTKKSSVSEEDAILGNEGKKRLEELRIKARMELRDKRSEVRLEMRRVEQQKRTKLMEQRKREKSLLIEQKRKDLEAALMEKRKLREEKKLEKIRLKAESRQALQEKLRRAKQLIIDARKNRKAQAMKLVQTKTKRENEPLTLEEDSPDDCRSKGISELPPLTPYAHEGVAEWCIPKLVYASEFVHCFASMLDLSYTEKEGEL